MTDKVTPFPRPHYFERMTPEERKAWVEHPVTLPDGTVKPYGDLNLAEHRWLVYHSEAELAANRAEIAELMEAAARRALNGEAEFGEWLDEQEAEATGRAEAPR